MAIVSIGNGIYARTQSKLQAECPHAKRDPRGTCYRCGQNNNKEIR